MKQTLGMCQPLTGAHKEDCIPLHHFITQTMARHGVSILTMGQNTNIAALAEAVGLSNPMGFHVLATQIDYTKAKDGHMADLVDARQNKWVRAGGTLYSARDGLDAVVQSIVTRSLFSGSHRNPLFVVDNVNLLVSNLMLCHNTSACMPTEEAIHHAVDALLSACQTIRSYGGSAILLSSSIEGTLVENSSTFGTLYAYILGRVNALLTGYVTGPDFANVIAAPAVAELYHNHVRILHSTPNAIDQYTDHEDSPL